MKRFIISFVLFFAMVAIYAESSTLTVTKVESAQVTGITVITYDLQTAQIPVKVNETYNISVEVSFDDGDTYTAIESSHLTGDVEDVIPGTGKQITWDGGAGFPNRYSEETKVKLTATPVQAEGWPRDTQTQVVDVTNPDTGRTWMDRNLGATQAAISSTDPDSYGDLYQWGRAADGHQSRTSATTTDLSGNDTPGHGNFIITDPHPWDWRNPQNPNLWQGTDEVNNPCPPGYRVPTKSEWEEEIATWDNKNASGAIASSLKLPMAGARSNSTGLISNSNIRGYYWSSTVSSYGEAVPESEFLFFDSSNAYTSFYGNRALGLSIRCIKDQPAPGK